MSLSDKCRCRTGVVLPLHDPNNLIMKISHSDNRCGESVSVPGEELFKTHK